MGRLLVQEHRGWLTPVWRAILVVALLYTPGCLFVRTTEHIITLREDGSGEGIIHLIDIRSEAMSDSLVRRDFDDLMTVLGSDKVPEFERHGRTITAKRLRAVDDTLMAEIVYEFQSLQAIDGLRVTKDEFAFVFSPEREVVRANGSISKTDTGTRIAWSRDAARLVYVVRERHLPPSVSIAPLYRKLTR